MKICIIFFVLAIGVMPDSFAQCNCSFRSLNYAGVLEGESGTAFQVHSVNGLQRKTWFVGLGTGLDYYRYRTVPLFLSVSKFITPSQRSFYVSLDGGLNFAWFDKEKARTGFYDSHFSPAFYGAGGIGYRISLNNRNDALLLYAGYSIKRLKEKREIMMFCINPPCNSNTERYDYRLNRLSLKLGWQF